MTRPTVSVLIPVYNRHNFIGTAIDSILRQSFVDFEIVVVDDGSTDPTPDIVRGIRDKRVSLVQHKQNLGIPISRNTALSHARGKYIAWLDSDDRARPNRLATQVAFLEANPDVAMIGSCAGKIGENGLKRKGNRVPPLDWESIRCWLLFRSAFQQSSICGRSEILKDYFYDPNFPVCEDVDMFVRLATNHRVANLPDVLIDRRIHPGQTIRSNVAPIIAAQGRISAPMLESLGINYSQEDLRRHVVLSGAFDENPDADYLRWANQWLRRILRANTRRALFDQDALKHCASFFFLRAWVRSGQSKFRIGGLLPYWLGTSMTSKSTMNWVGRAIPAVLPLVAS